LLTGFSKVVRQKADKKIEMSDVFVCTAQRESVVVYGTQSQALQNL